MDQRSLNSHLKGEQVVVYTWDLPECECHKEPFCPIHNLHFADCPCVGANEEDFMYFERGGVLFARPYPRTAFPKRADGAEDAGEPTTK